MSAELPSDLSRTLDHEPERDARGPDEAPLVLTLLAHPDVTRIGEQAVIGRDVPEPSIHRRFPAFGRAGHAPRPLETRHVSRQPALVLRRGDGIVLSAGGDRPIVVGGATEMEHTLSGPTLARGVVVELSRRVLVLLRRGMPCPDPGALGLVGASPALEAVRRTIQLVGPTPHAVLIRGETGVGKERVASALHAVSARSGRPFVAVNCAALGAGTAASQLFGHARGAFTGSVGAHTGYFEEAEGGTLFLDEIGEAPLEVQSMLLRALEVGEAQPVGGRLRRIDVRLLSATDAPLERLAAEGRFRPALIHRLGAVTIDVPPLGERIEDIACQLVAFLQAELGATSALLAAGRDDPEPWLGAEVIQACLERPWPGNSRELRAAARWMALMGAEKPRAPLPPPAREPAPLPVAVRQPRVDEVRMGPADAGEVRAALADSGHRIDVAARTLGLSRNTLRVRMRELGIRRAVELSVRDIDDARALVGEDVAALANALGVGEHALRLRLGALGRA